ncbi:hypothetical protein [Demequina sp. NBRC 110051]|uniref:hypothetical protein n=1 Tax=Demequina sp. NBRC 110051 TaxID=1570340 RepID=UPI0009FE6516|nr:hypothetical protein [Demequina sp. NBRC 110051]
MRDARDAFEDAGHSAAEQITQTLTDPEIVSADIAASARRRRRLTTVRTGTACVAIVAAAASALTLRPEPPLPAGTSADGVVRDMRVMEPTWNGGRASWSGGEWCYPTTDPDPYLPRAERGVTIASDNVRDDDIRVEGRILRYDDIGYEFEDAAIEPGALIVDESTTYNSQANGHSVALEVSWTGDALYQVDAGAQLVASGRAISPVYGSPRDLRRAWDYSSAAWLPRYDPATDRSTVTFVSPLVPYCLGDDQTSAGMDSFLAPDLPAEIHTAVQVRSEDGEPLATFIDAAGLDGTTIEFQGYADLSDTIDLTPPGPEELAEAAEQRDARPLIVPTPSLLAQVRDQVREQGTALAEAGAGARLVAGCEDVAAQLEWDGADLSVIPATADLGEIAWLRDFPGELALEGLRGGTVWEAPDTPLEGSWAVDSLALYLLDSDGALVAQAPLDLEWTFDSEGLPDEVSRISSYGGAGGCQDVDELTPGTYRALVVDQDNSTAVFDYPSMPVPTEAAGVMVAWYDLGDIAIVDGPFITGSA